MDHEAWKTIYNKNKEVARLREQVESLKIQQSKLNQVAGEMAKMIDDHLTFVEVDTLLADYRRITGSTVGMGRYCEKCGHEWKTYEANSNQFGPAQGTKTVCEKCGIEREL